MGYRVIKTKHGSIEIEEEICWQLPNNDSLSLLSYDFAILERAVRLKRMRGLEEYPPLDEVLQWDDDYQMQCRIYEQVLDYAADYKKANPQG